MWRAEENYRETKQGEVEDKDSMGAALLSAGTALLMAACLKRAVVLFLVEQWRVWVFLALNLIVVAIFFTSSPSSQDPSVGKKQKKIKDRECKVAEEKVERVEAKPQEVDKEEEIEEEEEEEIEEEDDTDIGLSKEELNERVEAFIVMFKQQLILDARKGGNGHTPLSYNSR